MVDAKTRFKGRGTDSCIFDDDSAAHSFCSWNGSLYARLSDLDDSNIEAIDRLAICQTCLQQNQLRSASFEGTIIKELKDILSKRG